eukprot:1982992-Alexandrium_andersonii.AAC.1
MCIRDSLFPSASARGRGTEGPGGSAGGGSSRADPRFFFDLPFPKPLCFEMSFRFLGAVSQPRRRWFSPQ